MSLKRISILMIAAAFSIAPLMASAGSSQSPYQQDLQTLQQKKKDLKKDQDDLKSLQKQCEAIRKAKNPEALAQYLDGAADNCSQICAPDQAGGQCPDWIFTNANVIPLPADVVSNGKLDGQKFVSEVLQGYIQNDNVENRTLCHAVQVKMDYANALWKANQGNAAFKEGTETCQQAVDSCPFTARKEKLKELEGDGTCSQPDGGTIGAQKDLVDTLQSDVSSLEDKTTNGCPECGASYYQTPATGAEKFAMIAGALEPYVGMGLGTYMYDHTLNQYYGAYGNYLSQCSEIGVPCNGPMPMGSSSGIAAALMPGYIGGLNSSMMSGGMMGMVGSMGMGMYGGMMPMGMGMMPGMYGSIVSAGLVGSIGMMSPMGMGMYGGMMPTMTTMMPVMMPVSTGMYGMMSPMGMYGSIVSGGLVGSMGMMSPMGMGMGMGMMPGMGMYGMMSPMGMGMMPGMYGSIVSGGLVGSMGMMSPMGMGMGMGMMPGMGMYGMMSPMGMGMGMGMGMMPGMGMYGMMSPMGMGMGMMPGMYGSIVSGGLVGSIGMMSPMGMYGGMMPMGMYGTIGMGSPYGMYGSIGAMGSTIGYPMTGMYGTIGTIGGIGTIGTIGSYPGGAIGTIGTIGTIGSYPGSSIGMSPYGYSPYGMSGYSPYGSQYSALYAASAYNSMQGALGSQNQQNLMLSQQNLYSAQLRYYQTQQQAGVGMGMYSGLYY